MKTVLYDVHQALGAKFINFCGWEMPIQYKGIIQEHQAVRNSVGLFDVSHMGRIQIEGPDAESFLDYLSTNEIIGKEDGSATYTVWCREDGSSIDDLIVYRESKDKFFVIVNACNRQKDLDHLQTMAVGRQVTIIPKFDNAGILALQGPKASKVLEKLFPSVESLKHMHFISISYLGKQLILARTGYTGEDGFELYADRNTIKELWSKLLEVGKDEGIEPAGLGARDTLRLEMGYALYGHEISDTISPIESVCGWTIKWKKKDFLGKTALENLKKSPALRHEYGIILVDKGIAREGYTVYSNNQKIGHVVSGTYSPSLNQSIAIVLVERNLKLGDSLEVQVRQHLCRAQVVPLPFFRSK